MRVFLYLMTVAIYFSGCRNEDDALNNLKWSCARVTSDGEATATPDCLADLERNKSVVLEYYRAVPKTQDGKIVSYALLEKTR